MPQLGLVGQVLTMIGHDLQSFGGPADPVSAKFWYSANGDRVWPVPGNVSLLIRSDESSWDGRVGLREAALVRQLMAWYGSHGLRITYLVSTKGYWDKGGTETGPRTTAQEAAQDSAFYLGYLKLPATIAITESQFLKMPNGWVLPVNQKKQGLTPRVMLVDSNGRFVFALPGIDPTFLRSYLDRLMGLTSK